MKPLVLYDGPTSSSATGLKEIGHYADTVAVRWPAANVETPLVFSWGIGKDVKERNRITRLRIEHVGGPSNLAVSFHNVTCQPVGTDSHEYCQIVVEARKGQGLTEAAMLDIVSAEPPVNIK
jgi:hypothetical protein